MCCFSLIYLLAFESVWKCIGENHTKFILRYSLLKPRQYTPSQKLSNVFWMCFLCYVVLWMWYLWSPPTSPPTHTHTHSGYWCAMMINIYFACSLKTDWCFGCYRKTRSDHFSPLTFLGLTVKARGLPGGITWVTDGYKEWRKSVMK